MEQKLYDAAVAGDVANLLQLIEEDPLLLDKVNLNCQDKNPLHIAAMFGHVNFVKVILQNNSDMCFAPDRFGRNPLHLAAIKGRLDVLPELIHARPLAALEKTAGGDTVLHLCIKYNQLGALKILVEIIKDHKFINVKNGEGMTVLHLAICNEQNDTIQYLLTNNKVDVSAKNANGDTALGLFQGETNSEIAPSLRIARAKLRRKPEGSWLSKEKQTLILVASLIATMAFQAGVSPPGGVWQDDSNDSKPHMAGDSMMAHKDPKYYQIFVWTNTVAFITSLTLILLLDSKLPIGRKRYFIWALELTTVTSIALTYGISVFIVTPIGNRKQSSHVVIAVIVWSGLMAQTLLMNIIISVNAFLITHRTDLLRKIKNWYGAVVDRTNDMQENIQMSSV